MAARQAYTGRILDVAPAARDPSGGPSGASGSTERLRSVVQRAGGTKHVSLRSGVALSTLGSYLAGGEMKLSTALQICAACDVTLAWLVGEAAPGLSGGAPMRPDGFVRVRRAQVSAQGRDSVEHQLESMMFSSEWLRARFGCDPARLLAFEVPGNAMSPEIVRGDLLLIDSGDTAISSLDLHLIEMAGELMVRRLEQAPDGAVVVRTDSHPPQVISSDQCRALTIVGRVLWRGSQNLR